jgi:hypothetical protein
MRERVFHRGRDAAIKSLAACMTKLLAWRGSRQVLPHQSSSVQAPHYTLGNGTTLAALTPMHDVLCPTSLGRGLGK